MTKTAIAPELELNQFDFDSFEGNVEELKSLPFAQLITPQDKALSKAKTNPYGIFIKLDNADAVNFNPDSNWTETDVIFSGEGNEEIVESGYIASRVRMAIVRRSAIKIFAKGIDGKWSYIGDGYDSKGGLTIAGKSAAEDGLNHQRRTLHLVYFLDINNQPLHESPLQFTTKGAFGGAFGGELSIFQKEIDGAFFKAAKKANPKFKGGRLNSEALALAVMDFKIDLRKTDSGSIASYICERLAPVVDAVGEPKTVTRNGQQIKLTPVSWRSLFIPKNSEVGQQILSTYGDHESFGIFSTEESDGNGASNGANGKQHSFFGVGRIATTPEIKYEEDGSVYAGFAFTFARGNAEATQWCEVQGEDAEAIADRWTDQGIKISGVFTLEGRWNDGKPVVQVESIEFPDALQNDDDVSFD